MYYRVDGKLWYVRRKGNLGASDSLRERKEKDETRTKIGKVPCQFRYLSAYGAAPYAYRQFSDLLGTNTYISNTVLTVQLRTSYRS